MSERWQDASFYNPQKLTQKHPKVSERHDTGTDLTKYPEAADVKRYASFF
jgi:hypothetical protein